MSNQATATPRIEALFGLADKGLYEAVLLWRKGRQTYKGVLETLYPPDNLNNDAERLASEHVLGEALDALRQEGFITTSPVGDKANFYQWEYELTPAGLAEVQKVTATQEGKTIRWQAMGTDGQMHTRLDPLDE